MKIQFDPNLDFQHEAINAVGDLFDGQEICQANFTVATLKYDPQTLLLGRETGDAWAEGLMPNGSASMADKIMMK